MRLFGIFILLGAFAGHAFAGEKVYVLGVPRNVNGLHVCFDEPASREVVEAAKTIGTGHIKFIQFLAPERCGTATGYVTFDTVLETFHEEDSVSPDRTMSLVAARLLMQDGNHKPLWAFISAKFVEPRHCNGCL